MNGKDNMEFTIQDTFTTYRKIIAEKDTGKKYDIFLGELMGPYEGLFKAFGAPGVSVDLLKGWAFLLPEMLGEGALESIRRLEEADALGQCDRAMCDVLELFGGHAARPGHIQAGIFLQDGSRMSPKDRGYTGFGGIPGYIMLNYGEVTGYNLARLPAALAHEAHHNIAGTAGWDPFTVSVGQYIIIEGLAEAFAAALYGEGRLGPWVSEFPMEEMPRVKKIYKEALNIRGFDEARPYIFGDEKSGTGLGIPNAAGYAVGYHVVRAFMKKTGMGIVDATFTPHEKIIKESGFFD